MKIKQWLFLELLMFIMLPKSKICQQKEIILLLLIAVLIIFIKQGLTNLLLLLETMCLKYSKEEIQNLFSILGGYDIINELCQNHEEAQIIINNYLL